MTRNLLEASFSMHLKKKLKVQGELKAKHAAVTEKSALFSSDWGGNCRAQRFSALFSFLKSFGLEWTFLEGWGKLCQDGFWGFFFPIHNYRTTKRSNKFGLVVFGLGFQWGKNSSPAAGWGWNFPQWKLDLWDCVPKIHLKNMPKTPQLCLSLIVFISGNSPF